MNSSKVIKCQRGRVSALSPMEIFIMMLIRDVKQSKFSGAHSKLTFIGEAKGHTYISQRAVRTSIEQLIRTSIPLAGV